MVSLERGWANSKPLVASPWSNSGPSATCCSADAGPIPCYWPCLFQGKLGQSHAIGIVSLEGDWANSMLLVAPLWGDHRPSAAHHLAGAGPIPHYWPCLFQGELGQSHAIGMVSLKRGWANSKLSVAPLWSDCGPSGACHSAGAGPIQCYRHCLFRGGLGLLEDIGSTSWSNCGPLPACHLAGAGPIPCYWPCLFQGELG